MKKLYSVMMFVATMTFLLVACGGDDDGGSTPKGPDPVTPTPGGSGGDGGGNQPTVTVITGTWYLHFTNSKGEGYVILTFNQDGTGKYQEFSNEKGTYQWESDETFKHTYKDGFLTITWSDNSTEKIEVSTYSAEHLLLKDWPDAGTNTFEPMTDAVRNKIEDLQKTIVLQSGYYVEKNLDVKEWFMVQIDGNDMEEFVVTYGKKRKLIEGKFTIAGNQMTIEGADTNGDGVVNDNDKVTIAINGNEVTVGNITFIRNEITADMLVGNWQAYRTVGAEYKSDGTLKESWDWELTGASTGDEKKDNDNARMIFNSDNSFESWTLRNGSWELVRSGSYSLTDRVVKCQYEKGASTRTDEWKILSLSAAEGVIERLTESDYVAYYMKKY